MSLLLVGVSHRTADVGVLDRIAAQTGSAEQVCADVAASPFVAESMVISTCNRLEVLADVSRFHGAVTDITAVIAKHSGFTVEQLAPHLYVHFEDGAISHLFTVVSGLDSMIVGEQQILGQVRSALGAAQDNGHAGRALNDVGQTALRVGKRVHSDTGIDRHGASVVSVALDEAVRVIDDLAGRSALVIGAGAMSALALQTLDERGADQLYVANRTFESAERAAISVGALPVELSRIDALLTEVDVVVTATGATGHVLTYEQVERAATARSGRPLVVVDLALPLDTDPAISALPGVFRVDLSDLASAPGAEASQDDLAAARAIVSAEVAEFLSIQAAQKVEPIVVSLRARADAVVDAQLQRLRLKLPTADPAVIAAVEQTLRRTVSTLLHTPTVRMKQFASDPEGQRYAEALNTLFDLDQAAIDAVSAADTPDLDDPVFPGVND